MNQRLVWNFEINNKSELIWPSPSTPEHPQLHWEVRYFWPKDVIITLHGLSDTFLNLSLFHSKHRQDTYYLLPNSDYNLKLRHQKLSYKPLLIQQGACIAYGKKIKLEELNDNSPVPSSDETASTLLQRIQQQAIPMLVEKDVLIYHFQSPAPLKLELARLMIGTQHYFSASLEGNDVELLEALRQQMFGQEKSCSYMSFLHQELKPFSVKASR